MSSTIRPPLPKPIRTWERKCSWQSQDQKQRERRRSREGGRWKFQHFAGRDQFLRVFFPPLLEAVSRNLIKSVTWFKEGHGGCDTLKISQCWAWQWLWENASLTRQTSADRMTGRETVARSCYTISHVVTYTGSETCLFCHDHPHQPHCSPRLICQAVYLHLHVGRQSGLQTCESKITPISHRSQLLLLMSFQLK